ncbi:RING-H2 finger protein ATL39-like [Lolium rigidum]|uniref:RING-H2 finger protein ATL39-like n=1 Tax=Lolium rigidum TaxID=89674 RepID=UPI001F5E12A0|nr:RING-H2 finger protein ATL39-like [Lolium rigidum]
MNTPNSWLFADNSRYSNRSRLLFIGLSFAIGIATFLLYLAIWYVCTRRRRSQRLSAAGLEDQEAGAASPGPERHGMSDAAIAALPTFTYELPAVVVPGAVDDANEAAADCAVCLGQVEAGETVRRLPKCAHLFHAECVDAWLRAHCTCPMCRAPVGPPTAAASKKDGTPPADGIATAESLPPV